MRREKKDERNYEISTKKRLQKRERQKVELCGE